MESAASRQNGLRALVGSLVAMAAFLVVMLWSSVAHAADTALGRLSDDILNVLTPIFVAFIGALAVWLLALLKKKWGIGVSDATTSAWADLARNAALRGAEYARAKAKAALGNKKVPGPEVLEVATNWAIDVARNAGLPEMARKALEGLIESQLFELRMEETADTPVADPYVPSPDSVPTKI